MMTNSTKAVHCAIPDSIDMDDDENTPHTPTDSTLKQAIEDQIEHELALQKAGTGSRWLRFLRWDRFNAQELVKAENALFEQVTTPIQSRLVPIDLFKGSTIYTISVKKDDTSNSKIPYVLCHGFGGGVGIWASNLDALAALRPVHAIDLLGFGRSSRPSFNHDPVLAEEEYVQSIEEWRKAMNIEKMILVGHSFGGYLSSAYALKYPDRIRHLICVDAWGYSEKPVDAKSNVPIWFRGVTVVGSRMNPFTSLRVAGPYALRFIRRIRPDLGSRFNYSSDPNAIYQYIYQINARKPSGERAFKSISDEFRWSRRPMILRISNLDSKVPMTFLFGSNSWIHSDSGVQTQTLRPDSYVKVEIIPDAGHHVYADNYKGFNNVMTKISQIIDNDNDSVLPRK